MHGGGVTPVGGGGGGVGGGVGGAEELPGRGIHLDDDHSLRRDSIKLGPLPPLNTGVE